MITSSVRKYSELTPEHRNSTVFYSVIVGLVRCKELDWQDQVQNKIIVQGGLSAWETTALYNRLVFIRTQMLLPTSMNEV